MSLIGKVYCFNSVHIYKKLNNDNNQKILFCLKCKCEQFGDVKQIIDSKVSNLLPHLKELSKICSWPDELIKWIEKSKNDQLAWIGFNQDLDNLEMVIYYNDNSYLRRIKSNFTSFTNTHGNDYFGKYSLTKKSWQSSVIFEYILDTIRADGKIYKYLADIVLESGLNNTIWISKFNVNGNLINNKIGFNHNNKKIHELTKKTFNIETLPFSNDYFYYFFNLKDNANNIKIVYQNKPFNNFPDGSVYDYDYFQTYPKYIYKVFPGGKLNIEGEIEFSDNLNNIISTNQLVKNSLKEAFYFIVMSNNEDDYNFFFINVNYNAFLNFLESTNNPTYKYLVKKKDHFENSLFTFGLNFKNDKDNNLKLAEGSIIGLL